GTGFAHGNVCPAPRREVRGPNKTDPVAARRLGFSREALTSLQRWQGRNSGSAGGGLPHHPRVRRTLLTDLRPVKKTWSGVRTSQPPSPVNADTARARADALKSQIAR